MKNIVSGLLIGLLCCLLPSIVSGQFDTSYNSLVEAFKKPPVDARPKVYWWCLNGNIDTVRAKEEFLAMKEAGITGIEMFEIGVPSQDTMIPAGPAFMSEESINTIKWVIKVAGELDMTVGLNLASSWNAGGSWVKPEHGGKSIYASTIRISGDVQQKKILLPFPDISFPRESLIGGTDESLVPFRDNGRPVYYEEIAVLAIPTNTYDKKLGTADIINVTSYFNPDKDELNWDVPVGDWNIVRYVCSNSGQQIVRPSTHSAGLTIDHFDSVAVETHLMYFINRLKPKLGDFGNTALKTFYLASYEARGLVWTPTLPAEFKKITGDEIWKFIPILFDTTLFDSVTTGKFLSRFKKTLSELIINNLYRQASEICNRYGLKINSEAGGPGYPLYNGPAEPLKAQGSLDIPRGEFWINHSRFYQDGNDSIDILRVVKEVAAASHIYKKHFVEEEAFTSFQHWQEGPFDMKPFGDRAFCAGMNRVVFHGFSHNITGSGFPGYVYHAGTHFNDKRIWWKHAKPFTDYLSRISAVFQKTDFKADVLWYYGDKVPNSATPKNTHFEIGPGYDYEVINTDILTNELTVENGKFVLSNGAVFELLVLEEEEVIHPQVLIKLEEFIKKGGVVIGKRPERMKILADYQISVPMGSQMIEKLWGSESDPQEVPLDNKSKIYSGISPLDLLQSLHVLPDIEYSGNDSRLLDYIHFGKADVDVYFIRNTTDQWVSRNVSFRQKNKTPEYWDPVSGEIIPIYIYKYGNGITTLPLALPPYGSGLFVFRNSSMSAPVTEISGETTHPPLFRYSNEGIVILQEGYFRIEAAGQTDSVEVDIELDTLKGAWEVAFTPGWGAPDKVTFNELMSWTASVDEGVKYYSGIATYRKTFNFEELPESGDDGTRIYLDLGDVSKTGQVWLNGERLGIAWINPYRFEISGKLNQGDNTLVVEIANTWSNRLTGDAITGENYTNTNILRTIIPANTFVTGDQTRVPWKYVPLIQSGLMGPVTIEILDELILK